MEVDETIGAGLSTNGNHSGLNKVQSTFFQSKLKPFNRINTSWKSRNIV